MTTKAQLEKYSKDRNIQRFLDFISHAEGTTKHGYNTAFGGTRFNDLSHHPNISKQFTNTKGKRQTSGAAGRYQFLKSTWTNLADQYGFTDFGAHNQDLGAIALLASKGQLENIAKGDYETAVKNLGGVWASFPSSPHPQNKHSWDTVHRYFNTGKWEPKSTSRSSSTNTPTQTSSSIQQEPALPLPQTQAQAQAQAQALPQAQAQSVDTTTYTPSASYGELPKVEDMLGLNVSSSSVGSTVLASGAGVAQASTPHEEKIFSDILASGADAQRESSLVAGAQAIAKAYAKLNGGNMMEKSSPLTNYVANIFDVV